MSHKTHPYGYRVGVTKDWKSKWMVSDPDKYADYVEFAVKAVEFLWKELREQLVGDITVDISGGEAKITIWASKPGVIIGAKGEGVNRLKTRLLRYLKSRGVNLSEAITIEVAQLVNPESNAKINAILVRQALEKRMPFRRVMKKIADNIKSVYGVSGVRIALSGRLGGAEMARKEEYRLGKVPLQTIRANIDYAQERAEMTYGTIGIKVWVYTE